METLDATNSAAVAALEACFRRVAESMAGLPFYNEALEVEAVGFRSFGEETIGVLITPWFLNLILIADAPPPFEVARIGAKRTLALPVGEKTVAAGGDESYGMYYALSFVSPMDRFVSQEQARAAARLALAGLFAPPEAPAAAKADPPPERPSRRALFTFSGKA